ncbi:FAD-binding domain protein [Ceratobasidium sp. AG-Ba]|nr:FAD-binding domain protein [Ceratobasidium sp. AG-Ba]QRV99297.1 FAD-binding domain protein [Ceratobasidium sp. AG-Ba]QRW13797.1 FAD-binding domain protein [Ceratobasidium sp. AG-Ba]
MLSLALPLLAAATLARARSPYDIPQTEWDALNSTVGGRLAYGVPLARTCFQEVGPNVTEGGLDCATVQANYGVDVFRISQFGAMSRTQWETCQKTAQGCLLDSDNPTDPIAFSPPKKCYQGSVAPYYISVRTPQDAINAFSFSKRTSVPLSIMNTGHDFAGRSSGLGTLALWTHNLKGITYAPNFVPDKCSGAGIPAMTYGAGEYLESIYEFADANGITFIGGSHRTVGAAGWTMGGGHSVFTNTYGLGVDRVRQFRIVTPDGQYRTANECQNQDLFWALRGGGGGTFGVVIEMTSEVVPKPIPTVSLLWTMAFTPENLARLVNITVENSVRWTEEGWGGYILATTSILANPRLNATAAAASLKPLTDFLQASGAQTQWNNFGTFPPLFDAILNIKIPVGANGAVSSRLIPKSLFVNATNRKKLYDATMDTFTLASGGGAIFLTTPYSYPVKQGSTSITPAWRDAIWHAVVIQGWNWNATIAEAKQGYTTTSAAADPLRKIAPGSGAYLNEADVYEPNAPVSFWGTPNYARLLRVKKKYDPSALLDCWNCVGTKEKTAACYL